MKFTATVLALCASLASAQTIVDIVINSPDHTTLTAAVSASPPILAIFNDTDADLTLFAPDDPAFTALVVAVGEEYVNDLLTPMWGLHLACVLTSHVLEGSVPSSAITGPMNVTSGSGFTFPVNNIDGDITVNGNPVTIPDIIATNGIVHSITGLPILPPCVTETIVDKVVAATEELSTLLSLIEAAGLAETLASTRPLTVFAPTNAAFDAVDPAVLAYLASNVTALTEVLTYHVIGGSIIPFGESLDEINGEFQTLNGDNITVEDDEINGSVETVGDYVLASNGLVNVVDGVLIPPSLVLPEFGPTTMAPATMPPATMAPVTMAPVSASPVTMAPVSMAPVSASPVTTAPVVGPPVDVPPTVPLTTIAGIVVASEAHSTLEAAVLAAPDEVLDALRNPSVGLTLFAPDNDAFDTLVGVVGQEFFDKLLTPEWGFQLSCVLLSHVLDVVVPSSAITGPMEVSAINGWVLKADNMNGVITIDGNNVTGPDIMASNGVVHSISGLPILPDCVTKSIAAMGNATDDLSTLMSLVLAAGLGDALDTLSPITVFAPTNAAFDAVDPAVLAYLASNVTALTEVLTYHVTNGNLVFGDFGTYPTSPDGNYTTLNGDDVTIFNATTVNGVDLPEGLPIIASNGIVHVIGSVLIPPSLYLPELGVPAPTPSPVAPTPVDAPTPAPVDTTPTEPTPASNAAAAATGSLLVGTLSLLLVVAF